MFGFGKKKKSVIKQDQSLREVTNVEDFHELVSTSQNNPVFFLKHSTRCPISKWAYDELSEASHGLKDRASFAFLDLITFRDISDFIAHHTGIKHESPQLFHIDDGEVRTVLTHQDVKASAIANLMNPN